MSVLIELAVGEGEGQVSAAGAQMVAEAAHHVGATGLRLLDHRTVDPSVTGAHLAGRYGSLGYLIDASTTHNAPYNLARRVLSFDRATEGRVGLVLRPGAGDEVSEPAAPDPGATDPAQRWTEYAGILADLWESFPRSALTGDQRRAIAIDDQQIRSVDHSGPFYRVAGPLDGPASVQGRPVLVAADVAVLGVTRIAATADAVIADGGEFGGVADALPKALSDAGRRRSDIALLARIDGTRDIDAQLRQARDADGVILALAGSAERITAAVHQLVPPLACRPDGTLRAALGLTLAGAA